MLLFIFLIFTDILVPVIFARHFPMFRGKKFFALLLFHLILSLWIWVLLFKLISWNTFYDNPQHIWLDMCFRGMLAGVVFPRFLIILFHYTGRLIRIRKEGHSRGFTWTGIAMATVVFAVIAASTFHGRLNFITENVTIPIKGLKKDLDGLKIVQISDLHMSGFYHHSKAFQQVMERINSYKPDLILNTGDFISYGWREFDNNDTILAKAKSRYGNYAIMGNHDFGIYEPDYTEADKANNVLIMNNKIKASGYRVLNNENVILNIGQAKLGLAGVETHGRFPNVTHGNLPQAIKGLDSVDLRILLSHDPNHWDEAIKNKTNIEITLSGHTHGMQAGIMTRKFKWSPASRFYPHWAGLYSEKSQYLYVNRGLGVLAIPFRIWMPPEITLIRLRAV